MKQERLLTISEASELLDLDVAKSTLRRWEENGKLILDIRTKGGQKRYKLSSLLPEMKNKNSYNRKTIAYARVSSYNQKDFLYKFTTYLTETCLNEKILNTIDLDIKTLATLSNKIFIKSSKPLKKNLRKLLNQIITNFYYLQSLY